MQGTFIRLGAIFAMTAVVLGAFGAHALKEVLEPAQLETFEIGVRYQFYHAVGLILVGLLQQHFESKHLYRTGRLFVAGICLFSGSLYLLATQDALGVNLSWLGPVTPIGGTFFIIGWGLLLLPDGKKKQA